jgi:predicted amidohydrolase
MTAARARTVRVAAVQAAPFLLDLDRTLARTAALVAEAAAAGARLVVFPETWLPGYPAWLDCCRDVAVWDHEPMKQVHRRLRENAVDVPGPVTQRLGELAARHGVVLSISVHERERGTLYNTLLTIDADGALVNVHRKLMPTFSERLVWGRGMGGGLRVTETDVGRIGGLICWEHWMPPARQVLHDGGEQIHVAAWPQVKEMNLIASRHHAFEGRTFVIACGAILRRDALPPELECIEGTPELVLRGGSAIIGPDGALLAGPVHDEEMILYADLDLGRIDEESLTLDASGHYARPDLFEVRLRPQGDAGG